MSMRGARRAVAPVTPPMRSMPSSPPKQHAQSDAREHCSGESLAVGNRNETGLLVTYFYDSHGNSPHSSTAAPTLAPSTGIAHPSSARTRPIPIHNFCHWDDRFAMGCDGFAVDGFHIGLA